MQDFAKIKEQLVLNNISIDREVLSSFVVPNTPASLKLKSWMEIFFEMTGDKINNEIHLDGCPRQEIHEEFTDNMKNWFKDTPKEILGYSSFLKMWDLFFDHVKIRNNNKIGTKCQCCERLSILRRRSHDYNTRLRASELFAYHRHMFMNEKCAYYKRTIQAKMNPVLFASLIGDSMDKEKTKLPHLARVFILNIKYFL